MDGARPCKPTTGHVPSIISVRLQTPTCPRGGVECQNTHPNIQSYLASVQVDLQIVGHVKAHVFDRQGMVTGESLGMWEECQRYDQNHFGAKLDKIDNYFDNESFESEAEVKIEEAQAVDRICRRGLAAGGMARPSIILLEPGPINSAEHSSASDNAGEKLEKHWKKLGFNAWSYTDPAWLCLSLEDVTWGAEKESLT
ncbi:uncharacterized protein MYCFIDRAFT_83009 [Pseudocercospora fijiensis CIRAD86]|uniref:Uncharacterized protein n=1 Tax=Pseudocercospora fijiensis (strain CIRAD86) TaxID=383855 RepID=M3B6G6_PSEFD|nr:uncharacterized protein MYCFIDRAFT_83009 [Pseudocercospora fijiensis CIRAD86]EME84957.1 hypothetical protein MYCFIDRAFT_83009 [Pseudocercospora fijiensis CIRAD86]